MTYGPVDFVALKFKGNQFKGEIFPELMKLVNDGVVRVIDIIVVKKDVDGNVTYQDIQETDQSVLAVFNPLKAEINGMIQVEDIEMIGEKLEPNTTAALSMFENLWAVNFVKAVKNANGRAVMLCASRMRSWSRPWKRSRPERTSRRWKTNLQPKLPDQEKRST